jgi:HUS1 checkpoint protein
MSIVQDVPITMVSASQFAQLNEPSLPEPKVTIMLPVLKTLRPIVDRMKNISEFLLINANMRGELSLKVDTDMVSIETIYKNLEIPQVCPPASSSIAYSSSQVSGRESMPPSENEAEVRVDIKKFARFLFSYQITPTNVVCCMVEGKALVLHVIVEGEVYLTYYIPVVCFATVQSFPRFSLLL